MLFLKWVELHICTPIAKFYTGYFQTVRFRKSCNHLLSGLFPLSFMSHVCFHRPICLHVPLRRDHFSFTGPKEKKNTLQSEKKKKIGKRKKILHKEEFSKEKSLQEWISIQHLPAYKYQTQDGRLVVVCPNCGFTPRMPQK